AGGVRYTRRKDGTPSNSTYHFEPPGVSSTHAVAEPARRRRHMHARNALVPLILASVLSSVLSMAPGHVDADTSAPSASSVTITAAWAGVWEVYEESYN